MPYFLLVFAFENGEILLVETRHQAVHGIGNGYRDQHQFDLRFDHRSMSAYGVLGIQVLLDILTRVEPWSNMNIVYVGSLSDCNGTCEEKNRKRTQNESSAVVKEVF